MPSFFPDLKRGCPDSNSKPGRHTGQQVCPRSRHRLDSDAGSLDRTWAGHTWAAVGTEGPAVDSSHLAEVDSSLAGEDSSLVVVDIRVQIAVDMGQVRPTAVVAISAAAFVRMVSLRRHCCGPQTELRRMPVEEN